MTPNRVLIICDNLQDCLTYSACLPTSRYDLAVCSSFSAGADLVEKEEFDFVIVDQGGEQFEARTVLQRAAQFHPRTPVLVVAANLNLQCYVDALELGAVDYLEDVQWEIETRLRDRTRSDGRDFTPLFGTSASAAHHAHGKN